MKVTQGHSKLRVCKFTQSVLLASLRPGDRIAVRLNIADEIKYKNNNNRQTNRQTNKETNKQTKLKQTICIMYICWGGMCEVE